MKIKFYNSYILPILHYCCTIWGKDNKRYINKINMLQKRIAKINLNKPIRTPSEGLFKQLIGFHLATGVNITLQC